MTVGIRISIQNTVRNYFGLGIRQQEAPLSGLCPLQALETETIKKQTRKYESMGKAMV